MPDKTERSRKKVAKIMKRFSPPRQTSVDYSMDHLWNSQKGRLFRVATEAEVLLAELRGKKASSRPPERDEACA